MNVGPVQHLPPDSNLPNAPREARATPAVPRTGNSPANAVPRPAKNEPLVPSSVQDEVKVQWDGSVHLRIYQFVKPESGALVLQVPSEQVLNVTRGIQESFQRESAEAEIAQRQAAALDPAGAKEQI